MSGAKGQPDTSYSYSVSLSVALSSRPLLSVGRIWADGKLLRGAAGDFKVSTTFRFYSGNDDQEIDPLIASKEGIENTPAYRGLAIAVFENLELGDYGNRIPFLTFEVVADDGPATISDILGDASGGLVACGDRDDRVSGYAAYGQSIGDALQPLIDGFGIDLVDDGVQLVSPDGGPVAVSDDQLGCSADQQKSPRIQREQTAAQSLPSALRLSYYDPALDYQTGEVRASSADKRGTEERRDLPAALTAGDAKSLVQTMIAREWAQRDKLTLRLPPSYLGLQPGAKIITDLSPRLWRIEQSTIDSFVVVAEMRPAWNLAGAIAADAGRIVANDDVVAADLTLALFDIPDVLEQGSASPTVLLAASSPSRGWKSAAAEIAAGEQSLQVQAPRRKTVLGHATYALPAGDPYLINVGDAVEVELIDPDQWLVNCDDDALMGGANLAVLGSEILQFGSVEQLGNGQFRLSRLLRGRAGTEWAMPTHVAGEPFAMIDAETLRSVAVPSWAMGTSVVASAANVSGNVSSSASTALSGESLRPLTPVGLGVVADSSGNLSLSWTRRSRRGFAWSDEVDAPLGESSEKYRVSILGASGSIELEPSEPELQLSADQLTPLGSGPATIEVRQVGDTAVSRPATCVISI